MKKLLQIKAAIHLADTAIKAANQLRAQFNAQSPKDAHKVLKKNLAALKSPETFKNMQKALMNQSPQDIARLIKQGNKSFSMADALELAKILTDEKMDEKLPEYLDKKIKNPKPMKNAGLDAVRKVIGKRK
tara:strand:+ start:907 stop:1299 length:393 start_codon:yes stop_codon:yes gene_type:complete